MKKGLSLLFIISIFMGCSLKKVKIESFEETNGNQNFTYSEISKKKNATKVAFIFTQSPIVKEDQISDKYDFLLAENFKLVYIQYPGESPERAVHIARRERLIIHYSAFINHYFKKLNSPLTDTIAVAEEFQNCIVPPVLNDFGIKKLLAINAPYGTLDVTLGFILQEEGKQLDSLLVLNNNNERLIRNQTTLMQEGSTGSYFLGQTHSFYNSVFNQSAEENFNNYKGTVTILNHSFNPWITGFSHQQWKIQSRLYPKKYKYFLLSDDEESNVIALKKALKGL